MGSGAALLAMVAPGVRQAAWAAGSDGPEKKEVKVGLIPLTDCASVVIVSRDDPRPIVMFTDDANSDTIQAAIKAGVTAYIVAGMQPERLKPILEVAQARFEADRALREELKTAQGRLAERKIIERAKGIVMQQKQISEDDAFRLMRKLAMDRNLTLLEVAQQLLNVTQLLS